MRKLVTTLLLGELSTNMTWTLWHYIHLYSRQWSTARSWVVLNTKFDTVALSLVTYTNLRRETAADFGFRDWYSFTLQRGKMCHSCLLNILTCLQIRKTRYQKMQTNHSYMDAPGSVTAPKAKKLKLLAQMPGVGILSSPRTCSA